ncbi:hypothetical protein CVT26_003411 [Gymnopilus dilepis]|uniref:Heterokaryon incompatibility domain-containing protein n=1 Tax=Gymnopilus dilepis TaxID=231916 RepID=A0A409Y5G7_9AGAR|nr:hypothetical protein CVT26_003411 [Gymnopilus dilepis]
MDHGETGPEFPPLLPVPADLARPNDRLCSTCSALKLSPEYFVVGPNDKEPGDTITLGTVAEIMDKTYCPFCRLVWASLGGPDVPALDNGDTIYIMMKRSVSSTTINSSQASTKHQIRNFLTYATTRDAGGRGRVVRPKEMYTNPQITLLANDSPTASKVLFSRLIREDGVDLDLVRTWIDMCKVHHGPGCNRSDRFVFGSENPVEDIISFRLVDVIDDCIVRNPPKGSIYLTLSYVWGKAEVLKSVKDNIDLLEKPGALSSPEFRDKIPRTIRDAMEVTKALGFRYIWVDSLCIVQDDDTGSKAQAIAKMDLVYSACFLTIIATGSHADVGISGVCNNPRGVHQLVEEIGPNFRLLANFPEYNFMQDSAYSTRAWTFQEREFTPRKLTFVGGQVSFSCGRANWEESKVDNPTMLTRVASPLEPDLGSFSATVQSYSKLSLSFDSDIHNAFAGFMRYYKTKLDVKLVYGLPDKFFDWWLLWMPHAHHDRRQGAPSWSWTGWKGWSWNRAASWSSRYPDKVLEALQKRTWIIWYHRIAHDSTECTLVWEESKPISMGNSRGKNNFYGGDIQQRFPLDCTRTEPTSRTLIGAPEYYSDVSRSGSGFLQFWTASVMFRLGQPSSKYRRSIFDRQLDQARVGVFGRDGYEIATLWIGQDWYSKYSVVPEKHEFIVICEARDDMARNVAAEEDSWKYMVMLIETHPGGWVERIALGSIAKKDLNQALDEGPVWKEIILG